MPNSMRDLWNRTTSAIHLGGGLRNTWWHAVLFVLIFALGFFARVWEFGSVPPGLSADEASDGVEAMSLYRYGTDRNGESFPVRFISWGSGQDALDSYIMIPFIAVAGLSPRVVRLPLLLAGILTLPLVYILGRKLRGKTFSLLAMFLLAISPWHIVISRWGLDANLLPLFFLLGFMCLLISEARNHWFIPACIFFGLGLYCYITSYLAIPLFLLLAVPPTYIKRRISLKDLIAGLLIFLVLAAPVYLYVVINTFNWPSIHIGVMTIPRLPSISRIHTDVAVFQSTPVKNLLMNVGGFVSLLVNQSNGAYDQPGYGYLYSITFPLILAGGLIFFFQRDNSNQRGLVLAWLIAAVTIGVLIAPVFVHNNLIFILLILFCAVFMEWLLGWNKILFILTLVAFLAAFSLFTRYYHGAEYKQQADREYFTGLLSAFDYARTSGSNPVCVTTPKIIEPYIFALFSEKMAPSVGPDKIVYVDPGAQYRQVSSVGRYYFGIDNCPASGSVTYILFFNEPNPVPGIPFTTRQFSLYKVLVPR